MKKLVLFLVLIVVAWLSFQYFQTGSLPFLSSSSSTPEERQLTDLADRFEAARGEFQQAAKSAGLSGMDMTAEADAAVEEVNRVESALARLKPKLPEGAQARAEALEKEIRLFKSRL